MGICVSKACVRTAGWLILQWGWGWEPGFLPTHLKNGCQHFVIIYATEVCWIYRCSPLETHKTVSEHQQRQNKGGWIIIVEVCEQLLTSSGRSSSSGRQLLRRRFRLALTFLLGSSSLSESTMIEVQLELATFPPILLHTVTNSGIIFPSKVWGHFKSFLVIQYVTDFTHILSKRLSTEQVGAHLGVQNWLWLV